LAVLVLFAVGIAGGWAIGASRDREENVAVRPRPKKHRADRLSRRIHRAEAEVEAAQTGHDGPISQSSTPRSDRSGSRDAALDGERDPLAGVTLVLDPGHNGGNGGHPEVIDRPVVAAADGSTKACNTTGTETNDGNLTEAQFNFDVAKVLRRKLSSLGAKVVMTRESNDGVGPCINARAQIANRAGAAATVSIHADGNEAPDAHGFDVIHARSDQMVEPTLAQPSLIFARDVRDALVGAGVPPANYVGHDGLDARDDLGGLNLARVPAVLVELGNMRSAEEAAHLEEGGYRSMLAGALVTGIRRFLEQAQS
jgi:N-acetylmuramoyl-L-alanine amidase